MIQKALQTKAKDGSPCTAIIHCTHGLISFCPSCVLKKQYNKTEDNCI